MAWISIIIAFFFAINIGASGTAAAMSGTYGSGAVKKKWIAQLLVGILSFSGAVFGGRQVANTIASGIVDPTELTHVTAEGVITHFPTSLVLVMLGSACLTLFAANLLAIPLSTSEVTVGSIVGVGVAIGSVYVKKLGIILLSWLLLPLLVFILTAIGCKLILPRISKKLSDKNTTRLGVFLIATGCYQSFAAGMNNAANAVGPLIGAGLLSEQHALLIGGFGLMMGALLLGGRVLETSATRLVRFNIIEAGLVSVVGATLVLVASILGIPVPLTQTMTVGIIGIGWAQKGMDGIDRAMVTKTVRVWCFSPIASFLLSLGGATFVLSPGAWLDLGSAFAWILAALFLLILQTDRTVLGRRQVSR